MDKVFKVGETVKMPAFHVRWLRGRVGIVRKVEFVKRSSKQTEFQIVTLEFEGRSDLASFQAAELMGA